MEPRSPALQVDSLPAEPQAKSKNTGVGSLSLLQRIFPTEESHQGLLQCRQILDQLSYQGSPITLYVIVIFLCLWEEVTPGSFQSTILSHGSMKGFFTPKRRHKNISLFFFFHVVVSGVMPRITESILLLKKGWSKYRERLSQENCYKADIELILLSNIYYAN